jgi:predicted DNA-binding transcriptional regulator AlpA
MNKTETETLVGMDAVAAILHVTPQTLRRWWRAGLMPAPSRYGRRAIRWRASEIQTWIQNKDIENDHPNAVKVRNVGDVRRQFA